MKVRRRPHRWPRMAPGDDPGDVISWECAACGKWIREYGPRDPDDVCPGKRDTAGKRDDS